MKKPRNYVDGPKFIYMRITVNNGIAKEASVGKMCEPKDWISSFNRAKGTSESARTLNSFLEAIDRKVEQIHQFEKNGHGDNSRNHHEQLSWQGREAKIFNGNKAVKHKISVDKFRVNLYREAFAD